MAWATETIIASDNVTCRNTFDPATETELRTSFNIPCAEAREELITHGKLVHVRDICGACCTQNTVGIARVHHIKTIGVYLETLTDSLYEIRFSYYSKASVTRLNGLVDHAINEAILTVLVKLVEVIFVIVLAGGKFNAGAKSQS